MTFLKKLPIIVSIILLICINKTFLLYADDTPTPSPSLTPTPTVNQAGSPTPASNAASATPTPGTDNSQQAHDLQGKITDLENKISDLQGQEKTLSSQIEVMDSQVKLTEYRIEATKQQILSFEEDIDTTRKKISNLEASLADLTKVLMNRIVTGYEVGSSAGFQTLLASNTITDYFKRENYLKMVEQHDRVLIYSTVQAKNDYANEKQIFEDKKNRVVALQSQLEAYTKDLVQQKQAKQSLLVQTQGDEESYQRQLAQAQAELASFSRFVVSQGGASLLNNQTVCDDWGCYYNQRESQWGNLLINGQNNCDGPCSLAKVGCLITSVSMVVTHMGHKDFVPSDIAVSSPDNFAVGTAMLRFNIHVKGIAIDRSGISRSSIDNALQSGPIIVGISYDGGSLPDHFVVLTGGSNGNYQMNDPFTPNGHNISFTSHYSLGSIVEIDKVNIN